MPSPKVTLYGRSTSHYTRVARIFAAELEVTYDFRWIPELASLSIDAYGGNPARKLPTLVVDGERHFGAGNICRRLFELAPGKHVVAWPEDCSSALLRNAHELVRHAMQAQVQWIMGTRVGGLPADNVYFRKIETGLRSTLEWIDERLDNVLGDLPPRDFSLLEVELICLVEHLRFRQTIELPHLPRLRDFAERFGARPSCRATPYRSD